MFLLPLPHKTAKSVSDKPIDGVTVLKLPCFMSLSLVASQVHVTSRPTHVPISTPPVLTCPDPPPTVTKWYLKPANQTGHGVPFSSAASTHIHPHVHLKCVQSSRFLYSEGRMRNMGHGALPGLDLAAQQPLSSVPDWPSALRPNSPPHSPPTEPATLLSFSRTLLPHVPSQPLLLSSVNSRSSFGCGLAGCYRNGQSHTSRPCELPQELRLYCIKKQNLSPPLEPGLPRDCLEDRL